MSLDPVDWTGLREQGRVMLDDMCDHLAGLRDRPVWRAPSAELRARHRSPLPMAPMPLADVHAEFAADVLPHSSGNAHPGFMGWVQGGGTAIGMLAEMLAGGLNANVGGRDHMAIEIEREVIGWTRQMFGLPATADGLFVTGTSMANFMAVLAARARILGADVRSGGLVGSGRQLTAYTSSAAHGCVSRALDMAGIGSGNLRRVAVDGHHRVDVQALAAAIDEDRRAGCVPFLIVGNAGTVDTGAIDDLDALADLARKEALTFHVDGAFGALAILSGTLAPLLAGLERADSIAFDWHKWGQVPYDAGCLVMRDGAHLRATFAADATYLTRAKTGLAAGEWWPCDYGPDLSRGFRALKVWFTLKTYGAAALARAIEDSCDLARLLADQVRRHPDLELLASVQLNIVCFGHRSADADRINAGIVEALHAEGRVAPSLTKVSGRNVIRAAIVNHRTDVRDIGALVDSVVRLGRDAVLRKAA